MRVNKKVLLQYLSQSTGKVVTLMDITNIQHSLQKTDGNNLERVSSYLKSIEDERPVLLKSFLVSVYSCACFMC